jgi:hypothetical protein
VGRFWSGVWQPGDSRRSVARAGPQLAPGLRRLTREGRDYHRRMAAQLLALIPAGDDASIAALCGTLVAPHRADFTI